MTEACGASDSDFKPTLKPYQLIGINFLMLLYRKKIGGGIFFYYAKQLSICHLVLLSFY